MRQDTAMRNTKSYIICTTPRSGSTLLCDLLAATGVAGRPNSYFKREHLTWWANQLDVSTEQWIDQYKFDQSYLSAVIREGTNGTQVLGIRLMWESVADLSQRLTDLFTGLKSDHDRFQAAFGPLSYLHLSRGDKVAQAVSLLKAEQSGLWHVNTDGTERERLKPEQSLWLVFDSALLLQIVETLEKSDLAWNRWFAEQEINPIKVTYESLAGEPQTVLGNVLSSLGLDPSTAREVEPKTTKLADSESYEWVTRFRK